MSPAHSCPSSSSSSTASGSRSGRRPPPAGVEAVKRAAALTEKIATIGAARDAQPELPGFVRAIFDYALGQLAAEQQWLAAYRAAELGNQSPNKPPARKADGHDPL
ncbi:MAG: hypothetical protein QOE54_2516 [Streptosporangiaceae bacterium]|jgi:hypothetical protein|nr:hypothetical protein [Streptosporangiaceae bacterium]